MKKIKMLEIKADNLTLFVSPKDHELLKKIQNIVDLCETSGDERQKKYATAILTMVQYFCGLNDYVKSVIISAESDRGKKYVIKIQ